ncbi:unnamed protein product [Cylindrotheca closterium]|uniref:Subtilisin n=1 Tax=Cylindrotheca closterium TaxID=2856 RepID=A0AAD2CGA3_9STRA|nr:unnamed protein product [Cylindrotheca closterium]
MKFAAFSALLFSMANSESAINDFQDEGKVHLATTGSVDELAKIDAHAAQARQLDGHGPSMCTMKPFDRDAIIERYAMNMSNPEHVMAIDAVMAGDLNIGTITALLPESSDAMRVGALVEDGKSGATNFPHGPIKALFTVGEINACEENHGDVYTGVPDGMGAYLVDDDTVRLIVQSESYGQLRYETWAYPVNMDESRRQLPVGPRTSGATFTGSHVQYTDFDRHGLADFMEYDGPAAHIVKGFGQVAHTYYNLAGDLIGPRDTSDTTPTGAHYSNTDADGKWAMEEYPSEADWMMQSLCSAHLEEKHQWGEGIGFEDDIYITNEEWMRYAPNATYVGLSMHAIDLANGVDYAVGSVTLSGFEKITELNPQHPDYVILGVSGYNGDYTNGEREVNERNAEYGPRDDGNDYVAPENVVPARIYVGMKGKMEDGSDAPADDFLARNGLRYGKVYGFAADMTVDKDTSGLFRDNYHKCRENGSSVDGKFVAINWQWDGVVKNFRHDGAWEFQNNVPGHEGNWKWWNSAGYNGGGAKTEHLSPDTRPGNTAFVQGSTAGYFGHYYLRNVADVLDAADGLPSEFDSIYYVYQGENPVNDQIARGGEGKYNVVDVCFDLNNAQRNCDADYSVQSTFEDVDGLEIIAAKEGLYAVIQEDSGNDLGERMFISSLLEHNLDGHELGYHFMAMSGGKYNTRMAEGVGIPAGSNTEGNAHEFSGVIDLSGILKKATSESRRELNTQGVDKGFEISAGDGYGKRQCELEVPINEKLIALGLQAHNMNGGIVGALKADRGGQVLIYQPNI